MRSKDIILGYFKKHGARYLLGVVFVIASTVFSTSLPKLLGDAIDIVDNAISRESLFRELNPVLLLMVGFALGTFITRFIWRYLIHGFTRSIELHVRHSLFTHLQQLSADYYVKNNTGDLITKSIVDAQTVRIMFGMGLIGIIDVITVNVITIEKMVSSTRFSLTLIAVIPLPFLLYILIKLRKKLRMRFTIVQHAISDIAAKVQENITGIRVTKAFAQEESENEHFTNLSRAKWKAEMDMVKVWALISPASSLIFGIIFSLFLYFGGKMVINGEITLGEFVTFNTYIAFLMEPISRISRIIQVWQRGAVSMQRMDSILTAKPTITDSSADMSITSIEPVEILLKNLTFCYPGSDVEVLKNINFKLETGGILAVMGATGSGKSTLLSLLMRVWEPNVDTIKISGFEPESIPLRVLRGAISYVPQDTFLFSDTILNNIKFYDDNITDEDAINAAKAAVVHSNIMELEKQYDTVVGERGMTLSGGQKQRISIARALSRKPSLLLLDDCLSAVDAETEQQILKNLREYMNNCTAIIVTHRIAAASLADRVLLLNEDGSQAALGTHDELVKTSPEYNHLLEIIASGERA